MSTLLAWLPALLALLCVRGIPAGRPAPWRTGPDLLLMLGVGTGAGLLHTIWLADFVLPQSELNASPDFLEYCWNTGAIAAGQFSQTGGNRSRAAALLPGLLARRVGIEDGLLLGATLSSCLLASAMVLWGRAAHSRLAGAAAALMVGTVGPVAVLGRTLTFYPEILAVLVLCSATGLAALRWRTVAGCLAAGVGAGLALLIDQRGLIWALPTVGLGAVAALWGPRRRPRLRGILARATALALPLWLSFQLGSAAYPPDARSLEEHANPLRELRDRGLIAPDADLRPRLPSRFVWGHTPIRSIPATLQTVAGLQTLVPPAVAETREARDGRKIWVTPWEPVAAVALVILVVGMRRRPLLLLGMLGLMLPYALSVDSAVTLKRAKPRFLANALLFLPPLLGVAAAVLARGRGRGRGRGAPRTHRRGSLLPLGLGMLVVLLIVLGAIPSWLGPTADWRVGMRRNDKALWLAREGERRGASEGLRVCVEAMARWPPRRWAP